MRFGIGVLGFKRGCLKCKFETAPLEGIGRFVQEASSSWREAYKGTSSREGGGRKSPIKMEIRKDFFLITVLFTVFTVFETVFRNLADFFGHAKYGSPFIQFFRLR